MFGIFWIFVFEFEISIIYFFLISNINNIIQI